MAQLHRPEQRPERGHPRRRPSPRAAAGRIAAGDELPLISAALLQAAEPSNSTAYNESIVDAMNAYALAYEVDTPLRVAHFLAQIGHESHFLAVEENGRYSPKRMREIFGCGGPSRYDKQADECTAGAGARKRPKLWTEEDRYARNAANLLSYVYASRFENGDEESGDGFRYRGRGMMQLTFKANYREFTAFHNRRNPDDPQDFVADPDLLVTQLKYGIESAFFYWDARNVNEEADNDDLEAVTRLINGGLNGLADRRLRLERTKHAMGI